MPEDKGVAGRFVKPKLANSGAGAGKLAAFAFPQGAGVGISAGPARHGRGRGLSQKGTPAALAFQRQEFAC